MEGLGRPVGIGRVLEDLEKCRWLYRVFNNERDNVFTNFSGYEVINKMGYVSNYS